MKKPTILFLAALLALAMTACSETEEPENPYRPVTYLSEYFSDGVLTSTDRTEYVYGEDGLMSESLFYQSDVLECTYTFEYDKYGHIIRVVSVSGEETTVTENTLTLDENHPDRILLSKAYTNGELTSIEEYEYDKNGRTTLQKRTFLQAGEEDYVTQHSMTYDRNGTLLQDIYTTSHGVHNQYTYKDGKEISVIQYDSNGEATGFWESSYNDAGQLIQETSQDSDGTLKSAKDYTYDETGLVVTCVTRDADGSSPTTFHTVTTYDEHGNQLLHERYRDGQLSWRITQVFEPVP